MEITIRTIVVAAVIMAVAGIVMLILSGEASTFTDLIGNYTSDGSCEMAEERGNVEMFEEHNCCDRGFEHPEGNC